ncbi:LOW QUALITY PROTEIN: hypothetical protein V2J09_016342 [Rumex salicifolius]
MERMRLSIASLAPHLIMMIWSTTVQSSSSVSPEQQQQGVPCFFVFGDSLSDNGNNNNLPTLAKVNYPPYGIDSPGHVPTGRFSNGLNLVDVIAGRLGFKEPIPPYAWIQNMDAKMLLKGVNYASGSAGIRLETGQHLGSRIPLDHQLVNHKKVVSMIWSKLGNESRSYLKKCLYSINIGGNDYLNNYFVPDKYPTSKEYNPKQYARVLMKQYSKQIRVCTYLSVLVFVFVLMLTHEQTLYGMGARKVVVFGQGELGCIPQTMNMYQHLGDLCYNVINEASRLFNHQLRELVDKLNHNKKLSDASFTCINIDIISPTAAVGKYIHPSIHRWFSARLWFATPPIITECMHTGFAEWSKPCCKVRRDGQCEEGVTPCQDRDRYVFFDNFHPTEAMNIRVGSAAYSASTPEQVHPIDIRTLVRT